MGPPPSEKAALLEPPQATKTSLVFSGARIAVVVPARDEARWIAEVVRGVPAFVDDIVLVDDGSGDDTTERARSSAEPRLTLLRHGTSKGVGAAIVSGYREALARGADVIAVMAGDGQMDPADLARVVGPVAEGRADYVKGDRFAHPDVTRTMPLARHAAGRTFAWLTRLAAGLPQLSDSQCGYTAIGAPALARLDLDALWPSYGYPNDLLGALARQRLRVHEVVVRPVYRGEASGIRPWHVATVGWLIGRIAVRRVVSALPPRGVASTG
jgi:glycosyltransferase involved in cell wall biosynthesis